MLKRLWNTQRFNQQQLKARRCRPKYKGMAVQSITAAPDAEDADPPVGGVSWHGRVRLLVAFSTGLIVYLLAVWVLEDPIGNLDTDWRAFVNTGNRLREGSELYRPIDIETEPLPWLYPPFALWLALSLIHI